MACGLVRGRCPAAVPGRDRGQADAGTGEGYRRAVGRGAEHRAARLGADRVVPGPRPASGWFCSTTSGRASTGTRRSGCARGSPPRRLPISSARTLRSGTCVESPKARKLRRTIFPRSTPAGYPLAERLAERAEQARAEKKAGTNSLGLMFPSPTFKYWRSSNFNRNVLQRAYRKAGWSDAAGNGNWVWRSLRHVFCSTAIFHLGHGIDRRVAPCRSCQHPYYLGPVRRSHRRRGGLLRY